MESEYSIIEVDDSLWQSRYHIRSLMPKGDQIDTMWVYDIPYEYIHLPPEDIADIPAAAGELQEVITFDESGRVILKIEYSLSAYAGETEFSLHIDTTRWFYNSAGLLDSFYQHYGPFRRTNTYTWDSSGHKLSESLFVKGDFMHRDSFLYEGERLTGFMRKDTHLVDIQVCRHIYDEQGQRERTVIYSDRGMGFILFPDKHLITTCEYSWWLSGTRKEENCTTLTMRMSEDGKETGIVDTAFSHEEYDSLTGTLKKSVSHCSKPFEPSIVYYHDRYGNPIPFYTVPQTHMMIDSTVCIYDEKGILRSTSLALNGKVHWVKHFCWCDSSDYTDTDSVFHSFECNGRRSYYILMDEQGAPSFLLQKEIERCNFPMTQQWDVLFVRRSKQKIDDSVISLKRIKISYR